MSSVVGQYTRRSNKAFGLAYTFFSNQKSLKGMWTDCIGKNSLKKTCLFDVTFVKYSNKYLQGILRIPFLEYLFYLYPLDAFANMSRQLIMTYDN